MRTTHTYTQAHSVEVALYASSMRIHCGYRNTHLGTSKQQARSGVIQGLSLWRDEAIDIIELDGVDHPFAYSSCSSRLVSYNVGTKISVRNQRPHLITVSPLFSLREQDVQNVQQIHEIQLQKYEN